MGITVIGFAEHFEHFIIAQNNPVFLHKRTKNWFLLQGTVIGKSGRRKKSDILHCPFELPSLPAVRTVDSAQSS